MLQAEPALPTSGLFAPPISAPPPTLATIAAPRPTVLVAVPPLPGDLDPGRPAVSPPHLVDVDHLSVHSAGAAEVATKWVAAMYTARFDDPDGLVGAELAVLAAGPTVAAEAAAELAAPSVELGEARWPFIVAVHDDGAGWWRIDTLLKTTRRGQVGPTSSSLTVRVHVTDDLLVDEWAAVP